MEGKQAWWFHSASTTNLNLPLHVTWFHFHLTQIRLNLLLLPIIIIITCTSATSQGRRGQEWESVSFYPLLNGEGDVNGGGGSSGSGRRRWAVGGGGLQGGWCGGMDHFGGSKLHGMDRIEGHPFGRHHKQVILILSFFFIICAF